LPEAAIEVVNLTKVYGEVVALNNVSIDVGEGRSSASWGLTVRARAR